MGVSKTLAMLCLLITVMAFVTAEPECKRIANCQTSHSCTRVGSRLQCTQTCTICRVCSGGSESRGVDPDGGDYEYSSSGASRSCASCSSDFTCDPDNCVRPRPCSVDV